MKLLGKNIAVRQLPMEETTEGGILLIDTEEGEVPARGKVVMTGPSTDIKVGNFVRYEKGRGAGVEYRGDSLLILHEDSLLLVE